MPGRSPPTELPAVFRRLLAVDATTVAGLYNDLGNMAADAFADAFGGSLATLREVADVEHGELAAVLGLDLRYGTVVDAAILSVHVLHDDIVVYVADGTDPPDAAVYLPVRPADCPPGTGGSVADLSVPDYREIVSSMVFLHYQLVENAPGRYDDLYRRPLARGLGAYAADR